MPAPTGSAAPIREAVAGFIACVEDVDISPQDRLARLPGSLDRISLAYHAGTAPQDAPSEAEPPDREYKALRELVAQRFPDLGFYSAAPPGETLDAEITVGDAIDDITDIYSEMLDVAWCFDNTSDEDALRLFRFGFEHHWGRHLCDLRGAVHFELFGM